MKLDIYKHFGTEFLTGAGVGPWYSVNDYAIVADGEGISALDGR